jgi:hypothetical protein
MSQRNRKTWVSVVIAGVIAVGMLAAAAIGGTAFFIYRHVNTQFTPNENADQQFAEARARFGGQPPLIELRHNDEPVLHRDTIPAEMPAAKLETLRVLAYDTHDEKLVRVSIPFWLLRMAPTRHVAFLNDTGIDFDSDRIRLTLEDLERRGPGLILDQADRRGAHVLVWTE